MRRRTKALTAAAVAVAVALFIFAPMVYSPTTIYGPLRLKVYPTYPNWESPSCWAFGFGVFYGRMTYAVPVPNSNGDTLEHGNVTQFGCPPASTSIP